MPWQLGLYIYCFVLWHGYELKMFISTIDFILISHLRVELMG